MMHADSNFGDEDAFLRQHRDQRVVRPLHRVRRELPLRRRRLVRRDREREPRVAKHLQAFDRAAEQPQLARMKRYADRARLLVAHDVDERPVAIEEDGLHYLTDSHFVVAFWSFGCETSRCHTTAQNPSVCGVMRSLCTVGITTQASAVCFVKPPSRPTIPKI